MIKITVKDKEHPIPERLSTTQWMAATKYDVIPQNYSKIIGQVLNIDWRDLKDQSDELLELMMGLVTPLLNSYKECKIMDYNELTFGQWVDLDIWMSKGPQHNLDGILTILGPTKWADEALYRLRSFNDYRTWIYRQYAELFGLNIEDDEIVSDDTGPKDPNSVVNGWYQIICSLASENLLWIDRVTEEPLIKTLNFMAYQKQKAIAENFEKLKRKREYELQRRSR
jgi:hypothetical protein